MDVGKWLQRTSGDHEGACVGQDGIPAQSRDVALLLKSQKVVEKPSLIAVFFPGCESFDGVSDD